MGVAPEHAAQPVAAASPPLLVPLPESAWQPGRPGMHAPDDASAPASPPFSVAPEPEQPDAGTIITHPIATTTTAAHVFEDIVDRPAYQAIGAC
jgi:hypothetical protein